MPGRMNRFPNVCSILCMSLRYKAGDRFIALLFALHYCGMCFDILYTSVVLNLFRSWDPLNATDVVWDLQVKIDKVCAPE